MTYNPKDASNPEYRDALGWEVLLSAAALGRLDEDADALGLPEGWQVLRQIGQEFLSSSTEPRDTETRMAAVTFRRRQVAELVGEPSLWSLDAWVINELVYFLDPTIHFLRAFRTFLLSEGDVPAPRAYGLPDWVETALRSAFPIDDRNPAFEESVEDEQDSVLSGVEDCLRATIERRRFRSFWRGMSTRLEPDQVRALRTWVVAVERIGSPNFDVEIWPSPR